VATIVLSPGQTTWSYQLTNPLTETAHSFTATATIGATSSFSELANVIINLSTAGTPVISAVTDDVPPYTER
jgi:hypothetical protein